MDFGGKELVLSCFFGLEIHFPVGNLCFSAKNDRGKVNYCDQKHSCRILCSLVRRKMPQKLLSLLKMTGNWNVQLRTGELLYKPSFVFLN